MRPIGKAPSRRRVRFPRTPPQIIADLANQSERARSEDESLATFVRLVREARALVGPRSHFGERLNGDDRADYRRVMRRLDNLSRAELWEVSRFTVDLLWGIGFATHKRAARGLNDEGGKILWRRLNEVAFNLYYGSQLPEVG